MTESFLVSAIITAAANHHWHFCMQATVTHGRLVVCFCHHHSCCQPPLALLHASSGDTWQTHCLLLPSSQLLPTTTDTFACKQRSHMADSLFAFAIITAAANHHWHFRMQATVTHGRLVVCCCHHHNCCQPLLARWKTCLPLLPLTLMPVMRFLP